MNRLFTPFAVDENCPLNDYPRPQMQRSNWTNLNGKWQYAILKRGEVLSEYQGEILVPFSPEAPLSGVEKQVQPDDVLYYKRDFFYEKTSGRVLLHFGAVDYSCTVRLNGTRMGTHKGGYLPFTLDVTEEIIDGENTLDLIVTDPSEESGHAIGKQRLKRGGIWYTAQSGIWQTVWMENVPGNYIKNLYLTPDVDRKIITVTPEFSDKFSPFVAEIGVGTTVIRVKSSTPSVSIDLSSCLNLWSPENPYLYPLKIVTASGDEVNSYFAMRKISTQKVGQFTRILLNNRPYFQKGLLDQGYWPDGLYTAPTDEAMVYDIVMMKKMGFNMLRKHIKIEPLRWYYHCDRVGMLVWQDIVSGCETKSAPGFRHHAYFYERRTGVKKSKISDGESLYEYTGRQDPESRAEYGKNLIRTVDLLYSVPCIVMWVPFNEGWGQFDALEACRAVKEKDGTRLVDHASGWYDQGGGDVNSIHNYCRKPWYPKYSEDDERALVLSEYGGLTYMCGKDHTYSPEKVCGYRGFKDAAQCTRGFVALQSRIERAMVKEGLCASVYTQVSDVEEEINGLLSYDRKVVKVDMERILAANERLKL